MTDDILVLAEQEAAALDPDGMTVEQAAEALVRVTRLLDEAEARRQSLTQPVVEQKRAIDRLFAEATEPLREVAERLRADFRDYFGAQWARLLAEYEASRLLLERRREKEAALAGVPVDKYPALVPAEPKAGDLRVVAGDGEVAARQRLTVEVEDPDRVPREFCRPDEAAIRRYVDTLVREHGRERAVEIAAERLPGVRVAETLDIVVTRNKGGRHANQAE